jgi:teichuronic acid biosynthesis glycosyltransferase TuaG
MIGELDNSKRPTVSVIMPAYNAERFIKETICSVIAQTYTDWELLVIDDHSVDSTCDVVCELAAKDERIRLIKNEQNIGVASTRNRGFDLCRGDYVALLDSDDVWFPDKLERQIALAQQTGADIVYCSYKMIDERGESVCDDFIVAESVDFESCLIKSEISCSTVLLSRRIADSYRFEKDFYHEDLVLWLQLLRDGYTARGVVDTLASYRLLDSGRSSKKTRSALNRWRVYRKYIKLSIPKSVKCIVKYAFLGVKKYQKRNNAKQS